MRHVLPDSHRPFAHLRRATLCGFVALLVLAADRDAFAQIFGWPSLARLNNQLAGQVVDFTGNNGTDNRLYSPILGQRRDLYVYLPPGYSPEMACPLLMWLHGAMTDERSFLAIGDLTYLDDMILKGCIPPVVVACPDGSCGCGNGRRSDHSFFINGCCGRYEDHLVREVIPFLMRHFSIRPQRQAHAVIGLSAGGFGAMHIALKHRDYFGSVASLAGAVNICYYNCHGDFLEDFDPATYRWREDYEPWEVVGTYFWGLFPFRAVRFVGPVFGSGPGVVARGRQANPADLIFATDLQPGELQMLLSYGDRDNFNMDAQGASFAWLAAQKGVPVTVAVDPGAKHDARYFRDAQRMAYGWLGQRLLPPVALGGGSLPRPLAPSAAPFAEPPANVSRR